MNPVNFSVLGHPGQLSWAGRGLRSGLSQAAKASIFAISLFQCVEARSNDDIEIKGEIDSLKTWIKVGGAAFVVAVAAGVWFVRKVNHRLERQNTTNYLQGLKISNLELQIEILKKENEEIRGETSEIQSEIRSIRGEISEGRTAVGELASASQTQSGAIRRIERTLENHSAQLLISGATLEFEIDNFLNHQPEFIRCFYNVLSSRLSTLSQTLMILSTGVLASSVPKEVTAIQTIANEVPVPLISTLASVIKFIAEEEKINQSNRFAQSIITTLTKMKIVSVNHLIEFVSFQVTQALVGRIEAESETFLSKFWNGERSIQKITKYGYTIAERIIEKYKAGVVTGNLIEHEHKE